MPYWIALSARDGRSFEAYYAEAGHKEVQSPPRAVIVLPEVYNVNAWARTVAERYAAWGYTVLIPDLFWRQEPGKHYAYDQPEPARAQGAAVDVDAVVLDVGAAADALRGRLGADVSIGVIGYCLGGRLSALAGVREHVDAVISYYGVRLDADLDELTATTTPTLLLFGGTDPWVPNSVIESVQAIANRNKNVQVSVFPTAGHGFDRIGYDAHHPEAASAAQTRVLQFLDKHLAQGGA